MSPSYYDILEIPSTATTEEVKNAYHRLARVEHPDKNIRAPEYARDKFLKITEAYEVLKVPELRRGYDIGINQRSRNSMSETWAVSRRPTSITFGNTVEEYYLNCERLRAEEREKCRREIATSRMGKTEKQHNLARREAERRETEVRKEDERRKAGLRREKEREGRHKQAERREGGSRKQTEESEFERRKEAQRKQREFERRFRPFSWILGLPPAKTSENQHRSTRSFVEKSSNFKMRGGANVETCGDKKKRPVIYVTRVYQDSEIRLRC